tara:strand:+ start:476 stop:1075 length:600 start_codon:yes stop_codon:yes gene_type:complete
MSPTEERVRHLFGTAIEAQIAAADALSQDIAKSAQRLADCLLNDRKILICGNGGSSANTFHFSSALINHFGVERPSLPVINLSGDSMCLNTISDENNYEQIFARQIQALGDEGDVLVLLTTSGNSNSILQAVYAANERGLDTVVLCGRDGGILTKHLGPSDIALLVNADQPARVREIHLFILHCFCDVIDHILFSQHVG